MNEKDLSTFHKTVASAGVEMGFKPIDFIGALITIAAAYAESIGMRKELLIDVVRNITMEKETPCAQPSEESSTTLI